jgi:hypothetical protein
MIYTKIHMNIRSRQPPTSFNFHYSINNTNMAALQTSEVRMKVGQISAESRYHVLFFNSLSGGVESTGSTRHGGH